MANKRYCEILLVTTSGGLRADVYNTYPLNACPPQAWSGLDGATEAKAHDAQAAIKNGPRFWLMDSVAKVASIEPLKTSFNGIAMVRYASVTITPEDLAGADKHYLSHSVHRTANFTFNKGTTIYELTSATGQRFVMQSWSQQVDPSLSRSSLADLGSRLHLPTGWTYGSRTLSAPFHVQTVTTDAKVLSDDFDNSYSMETSN